MSTVLAAIISFLVVLGIMVVVHEFGHFIAAKLCGVRVEQFSLGFPPRLFGIKIGDTDYCVSALPLGGYVKMTGESMPGENMSLGSGEAAPASDPGALTSHPRWQRMLIGVAGPFSNFILALVLMTGFFMVFNQIPVFVDEPVTLDWVPAGTPAASAGLQPGDRITSFDKVQNPTWIEANQRALLNLNSSIAVSVQRNGQPVSLTVALPFDTKKSAFDLTRLGFLPQEQPGPLAVGDVAAKSPAAAAGIQKGDRFLSVDGHTFHGVEAMVAYLQSRNGAPVTLVYDRSGKVTTATIKPEYTDLPKIGKGWRLGFGGEPVPTRVIKLPVVDAFKSSVQYCEANSFLIVEVLKRVLSHRMSVDTLSGPVGIAKQTGDAWQTGRWEVMIQLMASISLNLGILNLLPFPILDGGMILFLIIESIIRRDVDMRIKERVYQVAFVLIVIFAAYIIYNDFTKLAH